VILDETPWHDLVAATAAASSTAISDLVVVSMGPVPELPKGMRALHLDLAGPAPTAAPVGTSPAEPSPDAWSEWCEVAEDLLRWLV
jgi:hypothetical protein